MRRQYVLILLAAALAFAAGCQCGKQAETTSGASGAMISQEVEGPSAAAAAPGNVQTDMLVSTDWLASHAGDKDLVILQAGRSREAYDKGHILGALFVNIADVVCARGDAQGQLLPASMLTALVRQLGIDNDSRVVVYSDDGGPSAARMYVALDYMGLGSQTSLLDGHIQKWCAEQRPLSTAEPQVTASAFIPVLNPNVMMTFTQVRDVAWTAYSVPQAPIALVDARPADEYSGRVTAEGIKCSGHIPGARSVYWKRNIVSDQEPVLAPPDTLKEMYSNAGVKPSDLVVVYCRTGASSAYDYFVAKYLGYDVRYYNGSFADWCNSQGQVATGTESIIR